MNTYLLNESKNIQQFDDKLHRLREGIGEQIAVGSILEESFNDGEEITHTGVKLAAGLGGKAIAPYIAGDNPLAGDIDVNTNFNIVAAKIQAITLEHYEVLYPLLFKADAKNVERKLKYIIAGIDCLNGHYRNSVITNVEKMLSHDLSAVRVGGQRDVNILECLPIGIKDDTNGGHEIALISSIQQLAGYLKIVSCPEFSNALTDDIDLADQVTRGKASGFSPSELDPVQIIGPGKTMKDDLVEYCHCILGGLKIITTFGPHQSSFNAKVVHGRTLAGVHEEYANKGENPKPIDPLEVIKCIYPLLDQLHGISDQFKSTYLDYRVKESIASLTDRIGAAGTPISIYEFASIDMELSNINYNRPDSMSDKLYATISVLSGYQSKINAMYWIVKKLLQTMPIIMNYCLMSK